MRIVGWIVAGLLIAGCATEREREQGYVEKMCSGPALGGLIEKTQVSLQGKREELHAASVTIGVERSKKLAQELNGYTTELEILNQSAVRGCRAWAICEYRQGATPGRCKHEFNDMRTYEEEARRFYERIRGTEIGKPTAEMLDTFRKIEGLLTQQQCARAKTLAGEIAKENPRNTEAVFLVGRADYCRGRYDDALVAFKEALQRDSGDVRFAYAVGASLAGLDLHQDALQYYAKALQVLATHAPSAYAMGYSYRELGNVDKALEYYERTVKLDADFVPDAAFGIARIHAQRIRQEESCEARSESRREALRALGIMLDAGGQRWAHILLGLIPQRGVDQLAPLKACSGYEDLLQKARKQSGIVREFRFPTGEGYA